MTFKRPLRRMDRELLLIRALQQANKLLFARGAPLGSDNYFAIRGVLTDALHKAGASCDVVLIDDPLNAHPR